MNTYNEVLSSAKKFNVLPVVLRMPADLLTPLAVYLKLAGEQGASFLLESVEGGESLARYSFIGTAPHSIISGDQSRTLARQGSDTISMDVPLWEYLQKQFAETRFPDSQDLPSFAGGAIGYMGFDCAGWFEPKLASNSPIGSTDALFMFYRNVVAFDHAKQEISIISLIFVDEANGDHAELEKKYHNAIQHNNAIKRTLENGSFSLPAAPAGRRETPVSNWEREHFENAVRTIKDLINAGECYQVVLSQCFTRPTDASAVAIYRSLRRLNPSPYMFLLEFDGTAVVGASPEMLVRCRGPQAEYRPIAGTRPRGKTPDEDVALAEEMRSDVKETAEHQMLVDLGRNDLGRVARYGTVLVARSMAVEKYSHVQHLVSQLSAELRPGTTRFDALAACFPAGTVSGAPKVRAVQIIKELEPTPRGIYSGTVGYFDYAGNMDTCIAIRTLVLKDGVATVQAGAGIVADSVPEKEFDETVHKASALLKAIDLAENPTL